MWAAGPEGLRRGHGRCLRESRCPPGRGRTPSPRCLTLSGVRHLGCDLLHERGSTHDPLSAGWAVPHLWPGPCMAHTPGDPGHIARCGQGPHLLEARLDTPARCQSIWPSLCFSLTTGLLRNVVDEGLRLLEPLTGLAVRNLSFPLLLLFDSSFSIFHPHLKLPPLPLLASLSPHHL